MYKLLIGLFGIIALFMAAFASAADLEIITDDLKFPEGPLFVNGKLHWVEYAGNSLMRLDDNKKFVVHKKDGCGHNGLSLAPNNQLALVCYESCEIIYLDYQGKTIEIIDKDSDGNNFNHPNDIIFDDKGGAYLTTSGPFVAEPKAIVGGVFYRTAGAATFKEVADSIHYANGMAIINSGKTLLVGEHNSNRILSFDIAEDGSLSNRSLFVRMSDLVPGPTQPSIWLGPDGMKVDKDGNIFVAYYLGNKVLKISPQGSLLNSYEIPATGITNVEFDESGDYLYVTGVEDLENPPFRGKIWKIHIE
jgi:gluconolactonase